MSIPEACIKAAAVHRELTKNGWTKDSDKDRAKRIFLALAENLPEDAVKKALATYNEHEIHPWACACEKFEIEALTDAIATFLNHVAGDQP